jgi:hypothetical protein
MDRFLETHIKIVSGRNRKSKTEPKQVKRSKSINKNSPNEEKPRTRWFSSEFTNHLKQK